MIALVAPMSDAFFLFFWLENTLTDLDSPYQVHIRRTEASLLRGLKCPY